MEFGLTHSALKMKVTKITMSREIPFRDGIPCRGLVIARIGTRQVHPIVLNQQEWLSVLVCINVIGSSILSFYIFRSKRFWTKLHSEMRGRCNYGNVAKGVGDIIPLWCTYVTFYKMGAQF